MCGMWEWNGVTNRRVVASLCWLGRYMWGECDLSVVCEKQIQAFCSMYAECEVLVYPIVIVNGS